VRRDGKVVMAGDGQVTLGHEVLKSSAKKLRRLYNDKILAGFAGSTADAFFAFLALRIETRAVQRKPSRAVVELAKDWRTDKILRHLEALLLVADTKILYIVSGNGDVIEPDEDVAAIARADPLPRLPPPRCCITPSCRQKASFRRHEHRRQICIYTNENISYEELGAMVIYLPSQSVDEEPALDELTPREIVRELDKHVIGQAEAKRAVAIALRNRIRRQSWSRKWPKRSCQRISS